MDVKKLGDYEIIEMIGRGGVGTVYKAKTSSDDIVAVKVLNPIALDDKQIINKFFHEAIIMAKLDHPNIPKFLDFFFDGKNYGIVMEFIDGIELKKILHQKKGPLPLDTALKLARQALDAFQYAFSNGILHRDIKPGNIMVDKDGNCKIMDFGIGKIFSSASHGTATSMISLKYIPPERFNAKGDVDVRSDIYSLGLVFYEVFAGRRPFVEKEIDKLIYCHLNVPPDPPKKYAPDLPSHISDAILKALEKDPLDRFSDFEAFKHAIDRVQSAVSEVNAEFDDAEIKWRRSGEQDPDIAKIVGKKIGPYEILSPIGIGRYGSVWKARSGEGKICALKVFRPKKIEEEEIIKQAIEQGNALTRLDHPHITKFMACFRDDHTFVVAMEYVEGVKLKRILPRQKELLPVALSYRLANQILDALHYAHQNGILHAEIKPRNIIIDKNGDCKIMDLGISNLITLLYGEPPSGRVSLHYSAPEKYDPESPVDVRSDIYSTGLVFYEMFAGRRAFMVSGPDRIMFHHLNVIPEPPSTYEESLPPQISQAILKALEKSPADRFSNFQEFREAITSILEIPTVPGFLKNPFSSATWQPGDASVKSQPASRRIGAYELISPIGLGRFGAVWKAMSDNGNVVALKILNLCTQTDQQVVPKCLNEAEALKKLDHPNIPKFFDFFPDENDLAIAMELVEGIRLKTFLPRQEDLLPFELSYKMARQILDAFQHAHEHHISHWDFKPRNVMIDKNGDCKVMDFGIAKLFSIASGNTRARIISLHYAPPESYDPESELDVRSDMYSIGLVFFELFAGRRAFMVREAEKIMFHHLNVIPDSPGLYTTGLPPEISCAIMKALEKNPADRFRNFLEFRSAMERCPKASGRP